MDKKEPLVSVIMPAYNAEKFIGEAIESILNQTFKDFEFIILDDCSTDKTWEIIQEYAKKDERIISVKNEKNLNIALNRNKGVEMSKGKYIVWADADDISKPERIEKLVNYMENHPEVGICGSNFQGFSGGKVFEVREFFEDDDRLRKNIFKFSPVAQPTAIIRKECFDAVGLFNPDYPPAEDIELSFRIGEKYRFANVTEILLRYRVHPSSATFTNMKTQIDSTLRVRARYFRNSHYSSDITDYLAFAATWVFKFLPVRFTLFVFKFLREIVLRIMQGDYFRKGEVDIDKMKLEDVRDFVMEDTSVDYGTYGRNSNLLKRWLWWRRLYVANNIYRRHIPNTLRDGLVDFGCQFSFLSSLLSHSYKEVFLVDINDEYVSMGTYMHNKFGKGNYKNIINSLSEPSVFLNEVNSNIDLIIFFDVLEHVRNINVLLRDLKSKLNNDSYLLITLPTENLFYNALNLFRKEKDHVNRYFKIESTLEETGYDLVEKKTLFFLFNVYLYKNK